MAAVVRICVALYALAIFTAVFVNCCDPETEYENGGQCCIKCEPGRRLTKESCSNPVCDPCPENEYQPEYNNDKICKIQPYCDPNMNFEVEVSQSKTEKVQCKCKEGFFCSTDECHECYKHTECKPGFGVLTTGTRKNDTICVPCSNGKFSNTTSASDTCKPWQECESGYIEEQQGTDRSDRVCVKTNTIIRIMIVLAVILTAVICGVVLLFFLKSGYFKKFVEQKKKGDFQAGKADEQAVENRFQIAQEDEEISYFDHPVPIQDQRTENNNPLAQEEGKQLLVSQPECNCV